MISHIDDILDDYVLGALSEAQTATADTHVADCVRCASAVAEAEAAWSTLALALPDEAPPPDAIKQKLMSRIATECRFEAFVDAVADVIKSTAETARAFLFGIDDPSSWEEGPAPGVRLFHLEDGIGPQLATAIVGFVEIEAGGEFPTHKHIGVEYVLPVQGSFIDEDGTVVRTGELATKPAGSEHRFDVPADGPNLIYLAVVFDGVQIGDVMMYPGDPRI